MIGTNLFCAGAVAVMLLSTAPGRYWVLYAALVAENAGAVLNTPAWQARTPAIVGTGPLLSSANALNSVSSGTVRLIGPSARRSRSPRGRVPRCTASRRSRRPGRA